MRCVVIEKPNKVYLTEREPTPLASGFARIRVKAAAICATDLEVVDGNIAANYPITPGHEWSGVVAEVADEAGLPRNLLALGIAVGLFCLGHGSECQVHYRSFLSRFLSSRYLLKPSCAHSGSWTSDSVPRTSLLQK